MAATIALDRSFGSKTPCLSPIVSKTSLPPRSTRLASTRSEEPPQPKAGPSRPRLSVLLGAGISDEDEEDKSPIDWADEPPPRPLAPIDGNPARPSFSPSRDSPRRSSTDSIALDSETTSLLGTSVDPLSRSLSAAPPITSVQNGRRRQPQPTVEIPLLPLVTLQQYGLAFGARLPTERSRRTILFPDSPDPSDLDLDQSDLFGSSDEQPAMQLRKRQRGSLRGRRHPVADDRDDDDFGGYGSGADSSDGNGDGEMSSGESEDELAVRRLTRGMRGQASGKGKGKGKGKGDLRRSTRQKPRRESRQPILDLTSSRSDCVSSSSRPRRKMNGRRKSKAEDGEGEDELSGSLFDGEEEVDLRSEEESENDVRDAGGEALQTHRAYCEKCARPPADDILEKALKRKKGGRKRKKDEFEVSDEEAAHELQGWLECERCVTSWHWPHKQKEVLLNLLEKEGPPRAGERKRTALEIHESTTLICQSCEADARCFVCHKEELCGGEGKTRTATAEKAETRGAVINGEQANGDKVDGHANGDAVDGDGEAKDYDIVVAEKVGVHEPMDIDGQVVKGDDHLLFRCVRCKQAAHYQHLKSPFFAEDEHSLGEVAEYYQRPTGKKHVAWFCHQCREWIWAVDIIVGWRPLPANATEPERDEPPHYNEQLPREYLVKWAERGFRHATWLPHAWLLKMSPARLKNFLIKGPSLDLITDETLAARGDDIADPTIARVMEEDDRVNGQKGGTHHDHAGDAWRGGGPPPDINAESSIPVEWSTVDRVLDVMLLPPKSAPPPKKKGKTGKRAARILSETDSERSTPQVLSPVGRRPDGTEPPKEEQMDIDVWEERMGRELNEDDVDEVARLVTWCFVKWDDLQYDQSTWDTPPPTTSALYPAFKRALARYLAARHVDIPVLSAREVQTRDELGARFTKPPKTQPDCITGGELMPFQIEGFGWLLVNHFRRKSCILADDMGLGKTIQIASLLGYLGSNKLKIFPSLVIVPNSTITNWVREFEKWVPHMRVVPFYGEAASRKVIAKYELYHKGMQGKAAGLKAHVVLTTYDQITGADFSVFKGIPRWEMLCVDEGQRLKSDGSLIFARLKQLNSAHRILMTGTPLNNNIRELFNLLNFLDPEVFPSRALPDLEAKYAQDKLTGDLVKELHVMVRPYILRRIKADVLKLPPKVEIIVPISLAPLQKHVYKGILERNAEILEAILQAKRKKGGKGLSGGSWTGLSNR